MIASKENLLFRGGQIGRRRGRGEFIRIEDTTTTSFSRILINDQIPFLELHPRCTGGAEGLRQGQAQGLLRGGARRPSRPLQ